MPNYAIVFARSARKELEVLDPPMIGRVIARIEALAHDPRPDRVMTFELCSQEAPRLTVRR